MGDAIGNEGTVLTRTMASGEQCKEGYIYKISNNKATVTTAKGDEAVLIGYEDSENPDGTARTGDVAKFVDSGIVYVASVKNVTYTVDGLVYVDNTVNGMCTSSAQTSGATIIGRFAGSSGLTTGSTDGELIPVKLDLRGKKTTS